MASIRSSNIEKLLRIDQGLSRPGPVSVMIPAVPWDLSGGNQWLRSVVHES